MEEEEEVVVFRLGGIVIQVGFHGARTFVAPELQI